MSGPDPHAEFDARLARLRRLYDPGMDAQLAQAYREGRINPDTGGPLGNQPRVAVWAWLVAADRARREASRRAQYRYVCPRCGTGSCHPQDAAHRYCAVCHRFEDDLW